MFKKDPITAYEIIENPKPGATGELKEPDIYDQHTTAKFDGEYALRATPYSSIAYIALLNKMHRDGYDLIGKLDEDNVLFRKSAPDYKQIHADYLDQARTVIREEIVKILTELKEQE